MQLTVILVGAAAILSGIAGWANAWTRDVLRRRDERARRRRVPPPEGRELRKLRGQVVDLYAYIDSLIDVEQALRQREQALLRQVDGLADENGELRALNWSLADRLQERNAELNDAVATVQRLAAEVDYLTAEVHSKVGSGRDYLWWRERIAHQSDPADELIAQLCDSNG